MNHTDSCVHWFLRLALFLTAIVAAGCTIEPTEPADVPPPLEVLSARAFYGEACQLAEGWRSDAQLYEIQADVLFEGQQGALMVNYGFVSPSEDRLEYGVLCFSSGCVGQEFAVAFLIGVGTIEFEAEMIDSAEAAAIGFYNGGRDYVDQGDPSIWVALTTDTPRDVGPTVWLAHFGYLTRSPLHIVIDPYTGEVVRIDE